MSAYGERMFILRALRRRRIGPPNSIAELLCPVLIPVQSLLHSKWYNCFARMSSNDLLTNPTADGTPLAM